MSIILNVNGSEYQFPEPNDNDWGQDVTDWAAAITTGTIQKEGGDVSLINDLDLGLDAGIISNYFKSRTVDIADNGVLRLANTDTIEWRNSTNTGNNVLSLDGNTIKFNGESVGYRFLGDLEDVDTSTETLGDFLYFDGTNWVDKVININDIDEVTVTTPTLNDYLKYDGTEWVNSKILINELDDVNIVTPVANQVLTYDGTNWINASVGGTSTDLTGTVYDNGTPQDVEDTGTTTGYVTSDILGTGVITGTLIVNAQGTDHSSYTRIFYNQTDRHVYIQYGSADGLSWRNWKLELNQEDIATTQETIDGIDAVLPDALDIKNRYVYKDSQTGAASLPTGDLAQRPSTPEEGMFRFNSETQSFEGYSSGSWAGVGGASGGTGNPFVYEHENIVTEDYTIKTGHNAMSAGPLEIADGVTVTVPDGSNWVIV